MTKSTPRKIIELILALVVPVILIFSIPLPINVVGTISAIETGYIEVYQNGQVEKINISSSGEETIIADATTFEKTSLKVGDTVEIHGISSIFGNNASKIYVVSDKN